MRSRSMGSKCVAAVILLATAAAPALSGDVDASTPASLVATYDSLANAILAGKKTEWNVVHTILATTYQHAQAVKARAMAKIKAGEPARGELETLAALVAQLGNEGDASVAAIRKRLLEGGHHHHAAAGEKESLYEEGFVIVTRPAKRVFLDASKSIGKLGRSPDIAALESEWQRVSKQFMELCEGAGG